MKAAFLSILATGCAVGTAMAAPGLSQPTSVVELFTSQGCSSCPKANRFVVDLDTDFPDVLTLSYGVTYWDYLGWKDTFGHADFTARQRQYDQVMESGMYTPMMVVGGQTHAPRLKRGHVLGASVPPTIELMARDGELCLGGELPDGAKLALVNYVPGVQSVPVKKGENRGRKLELANVVTGIGYAVWSGQPQCGLRPEQGLAVLAHHPASSEIIGLARFEP
ncbi:MAG: DUF1223 domain-containing protein [Litorimonas sp.]